MKTPIEIINELAVKLTGSTFPVSDLYIQAIEEYGKQMYNQAIEDAADNAETDYDMANVRIDSILQLKK